VTLVRVLKHPSEGFAEQLAGRFAVNRRAQNKRREAPETLSQSDSQSGWLFFLLNAKTLAQAARPVRGQMIRQAGIDRLETILADELPCITKRYSLHNKM
jgi:hypothetical protein